MVQEQESEPKVWASVGMKVALPGYENQDIHMGVSGIPINCTPKLLQAHLDGARKTLQEILESLAQEMARILKENYGRGK